MLKKICSVMCAFLYVLNIASVESLANSGKIEVGDYLLFGTYLDRPILWQCVDIDENGPLMYSTRAISCKSFDADGDSTEGSHANSYARRSLKGSNRWADSNIRTWLNTSGVVEYPCGNEPQQHDNYYAKKLFIDYDAVSEYREKYGWEDPLEEGFLTGFTESELEYVKTVEIKTPLYEKEFSNMKPYSRIVSDEERTFLNRKDVTVIDLVHRMNPPLKICHDGKNILGVFEMHLYEEKTQERFFLPSTGQLMSLAVKNMQNSELVDVSNKYITKQCFDKFRLSDGTGFYNSQEDFIFSVGTRTPNVKTPDLVCFASDEHLPQQDPVYNEESYDKAYENVKRSDYANSGLHIIAPMFYFNEAAGTFVCGDGSKENPYSVEEKGIQILINGKNFHKKKDTFVKGGVTMISADDICEALGIMKSDTNIWVNNNAKQEGVFYVSHSDVTYMLNVNSNKAVDVKQNVTFEMNAPVEMVNDELYVPLRGICDLFGFEVKWDAEGANVIINSDIDTILYNYVNDVYPDFESFYANDQCNSVYSYQTEREYLDKYIKCLEKMGIHYVESKETEKRFVLKYSYEGAKADDYLEIIIDKVNSRFAFERPHEGGIEQ